MWVCRECGSRFSEPISYNPENVEVLNYGDFRSWGDWENEDVCPFCYSMDIVSEREDDDEEGFEGFDGD